MWDLSSSKPMLHAVEAQSHNHWATGRPKHIVFNDNHNFGEERNALFYASEGKEFNQVLCKRGAG